MIFNDPFPLFTVRVPAARSTVHTTAWWSDSFQRQYFWNAPELLNGGIREHNIARFQMPSQTWPCRGNKSFDVYFGLDTIGQMTISFHDFSLFFFSFFTCEKEGENPRKEEEDGEEDEEGEEGEFLVKTGQRVATRQMQTHCVALSHWNRLIFFHMFPAAAAAAAIAAATAAATAAAAAGAVSFT